MTFPDNLWLTFVISNETNVGDIAPVDRKPYSYSHFKQNIIDHYINKILSMTLKCLFIISFFHL